MKIKFCYISILLIIAILLISIFLWHENVKMTNDDELVNSAHLLIENGTINQISDDYKSILITSCNDNNTYTLKYNSNKETFNQYKPGDKVTFGYFSYNKHNDTINIYYIQFSES